ncbi:MAG: autotransporter domain-containing protein [Phycisphaerales bacterium]
MNRIIALLLAALLPATAASAASDLPSAFDLRDIDGHSYIGPVRDQGPIGSCYSFAVLAAAESAWNRAHNLYDDQAIDLSESFIVWSLDPLYDGLAGVNGGYHQDAAAAIVEHGVPLESDFPYATTDPGENLHWDDPRIPFQSWYLIPTNDVETTKRVIHSIGAVMAAIYFDIEAPEFYDYESGVYENGYRVPQQTDPSLDIDLIHAIALVGWDDNPGDGGMGVWILRNSWGENWGQDGYMRMRYLSSSVNFAGQYITAGPWTGESTILENTGVIEAATWESGGTLNAHGVDLWGGQASGVTNSGSIAAEARAQDELATARGVYLWGGPQGYVVNEGDIAGAADSENNQAIAYAICFQGGRVENQGRLTAEAESRSEMALAFGIWASNGSNALEIANSGDIVARADESDADKAYGLWAGSRSMTRVTNTGTISAQAGQTAAGVLLTGGPATLNNSGTIAADAEQNGVGVLVAGGWIMIRNSGTIRGSQNSIVSLDNELGATPCNVLLTLRTGSHLAGPVSLVGAHDEMMLTGNGSEDDVFEGVETLAMIGEDWSLSGDSSFGDIMIELGRLGIDGVIAGDTTIEPNGVLGGGGTLTGDVTNAGAVAPGHSIGHLTIDGDFTQGAGGTLEIEIGDGVADRLTVTGAAELAGTLLVVPDGYAAGGSYTILDANEISGDFNSIQSVAVLGVELSDDTPGSLSLDVTRNSYASLASCFNRSLATSLDGVRADAEGDLADLLDRMDLALTTYELNADLTELTPRIHGLATTLALEDGQAGFETLRRRMDRTDRAEAAGAESEDGATFWAETPVSHSRYESDGAYFGTRENLYGLTAGVEHDADDGLRLGVAVSGTESRYEADDSGDQGENQSLQVHLYGVWSDPQRSGGWRLGAALGAGAAVLDADRSIAFAGRRTHSEHDGGIFDALLHGGYDWTRGDWVFGPTFGLGWVRLCEEGFREYDAGSADLNVESRDTDSLRGVLGVRLAREVKWSDAVLEPQLRAAWLHEFSRDAEDLKATLIGGGDFVTPGRDLARDGVVLGIGLNVRFSEAIFASLSYDHTQQSGDGATDHALHAQMGIRF